MAIPIKYNWRNLVVRRTTTLMTALGIALSVAVLVADLSLINGLQAVFRASGNPLQILVMRIGSQSELGSSISRETYQDIEWEPDIARDRSGQPMASLEMVTVINLPSVDHPNGMNVTLRGLEPVGIAMREVKVRDGRWFRPGHREVVVGAAVAQRYPGARLGARLAFGGGQWDVVGVMKSAEPAVNSEIWGDLNQISTDFNRQNQLNSVLIRAAAAAAIPSLIRSLKGDRRLNVSPVREKQYYASLTSAGAPLEFLGIVVSIIMAVGSAFAAMNTMYASVALRSQEIGTLRALGFSRRNILLSFLLEALLLAFAGGIVGCLLVLPLNGITTGIGSFVTFSEFEFRFRVGLGAILPGLMFVLITGAVGGVFRRGWRQGSRSSRRCAAFDGASPHGSAEIVLGGLMAWQLHAVPVGQHVGSRNTGFGGPHEGPHFAFQVGEGGAVNLGNARFVDSELISDLLHRHFLFIIERHHHALAVRQQIQGAGHDFPLLVAVALLKLIFLVFRRYVLLVHQVLFRNQVGTHPFEARGV